VKNQTCFVSEDEVGSAVFVADSCDNAKACRVTVVLLVPMRAFEVNLNVIAYVRRPDPSILIARWCLINGLIINNRNLLLCKLMELVHNLPLNSFTFLLLNAQLLPQVIIGCLPRNLGS
jgi:hypothetical protein